MKNWIVNDILVAAAMMMLYRQWYLMYVDATFTCETNTGS